MEGTVNDVTGRNYTALFVNQRHMLIAKYQLLLLKEAIKDGERKERRKKIETPVQAAPSLQQNGIFHTKWTPCTSSVNLSAIEATLPQKV